MRRAEEAGFAGVAPLDVAGLRREADERRHVRFHRAFKLGKYRPDTGPTAGRLVAWRTAGHALLGIVSAGGTNDGANDGELVHHLRHARKQLANSSARDVGRDFPELAANLPGRIGLHVPHVLMRRSTGKKDIDDGLVRPFGALLFLRLQDLRQRQTAHCQPADFQKTPPRNPVAELIFFSKNCNHGKQGRSYPVIRLGTLSCYSKSYTIVRQKSPFHWAYLSTLYSRSSRKSSFVHRTTGSPESPVESVDQVRSFPLFSSGK